MPADLGKGVWVRLLVLVLVLVRVWVGMRLAVPAVAVVLAGVEPAQLRLPGVRLGDPCADTNTSQRQAD
jgi:hypothetical protein